MKSNMFEVGIRRNFNSPPNSGPTYIYFLQKVRIEKIRTTINNFFHCADEANDDEATKKEPTFD